MVVKRPLVFAGGRCVPNRSKLSQVGVRATRSAHDPPPIERRTVERLGMKGGVVDAARGQSKSVSAYGARGGQQKEVDIQKICVETRP